MQYLPARLRQYDELNSVDEALRMLDAEAGVVGTPSNAKAC